MTDEGLTGDSDAGGGDALKTSAQEHEREVLRAGEHCGKRSDKGWSGEGGGGEKGEWIGDKRQEVRVLEVWEWEKKVVKTYTESDVRYVI